MVIVGAKFGVWLKSPLPQADLKGSQPYPVTFDLDPTWFDSSSPHPYWVDGDGEVMVVRGPDGALSTREQVRDWAGGATLTWVDPDWRLDPAGVPPAGVPAVWINDTAADRLELTIYVTPTVGMVLDVSSDGMVPPTPPPTGWKKLGSSASSGSPRLIVCAPEKAFWVIMDQVWQDLTNETAMGRLSGHQLLVTATDTTGPVPHIWLDLVTEPPPPTEPLPPAPPTKPGADGVGQWTMGDAAAPGQLVLAITTPSGPSSASTFTIDIEPFTGTTAEAGNPYRGVVWLNGDRTQRTVLGMAASVWNGYYPAHWGGHRLRFTIDAVNVLSFTNLGVSPA
jgi:hypothetical protein